MANYRFLAYDLRLNTALAELQPSSARYDDSLNGAATFSMTLPVNTASVASVLAATVPERTIVYVERDGVLVNGYIIWQRTLSGSGPIQLSGASIPSIWRRNRIISNLTYAAVDQFTIARALISHLASQPGGDLGIVLGSSLSGVLRDRTYAGYERKNIGDAVSQLGAVENGFDWAIDIAWVAGVPQKSLMLSYPRRGRIAGSTGVVFESGKNIVDYTQLEDGTRSARVVDALGAGDGLDMLISTAASTALIDAGYPLTAQVLSYRDVSVQATLNAHALANVTARKETPTFMTVEIEPDDVDAGLGTWIVGDDVLVRITDLNFPSVGPPGYQAYHRVVGYEVNLPPAGPETVKITLGDISG